MHQSSRLIDRAVRSFGETGTVTFSSNDPNLAGFEYSLLCDRITMFAPATGTSATIPVTLWSESSTLYVRAVDRANNPSDITTWSLRANPREVTTPPVRADVNGDRRADLATVLDQGNGRTAVWNFLSTGTGFIPGHIAWDAGDDGGFPLYRAISAAGDFTGDGLTDIALLREDPDNHTRLHLLRSDGNRYIAENDPRWTAPATRCRTSDLPPPTSMATATTTSP